MALRLEDADRRSALRQPTRPKAVMVQHDSGERAAVLVDVSRRGLRIRTRHLYDCGSEVTVVPPSHFALQPIRARIMRQCVREEDDGEVFEMGLEFMDLTEEDSRARHDWFLALRQAA